MLNQFLNDKVTRTLGLHTVALVSSGSSALYHILRNLELTSNDEVLISSFNCEKLLVVLKLLKIKYRFVDITTKYFAPNLLQYKKKANKNTKVIIHAHMWGYVTPDIFKIMKWAKENNIVLVEDIASSFGLKYKQKTLGTFGNYCFGSFNSSKPFDLGKGGFYTLDDKYSSNVKIPICLKMINTNFYNSSIKFLRKLNNKYILLMFLNFISQFRMLVAEHTYFSETIVNRAINNLQSNKINTRKILEILNKKTNIQFISPNNDEKYSPRIVVMANNKKKLIIDREKIGMWIGIDYTHPLHFYEHKVLNNFKNTDEVARTIIQIVTDQRNATFKNVIYYLEHCE